MLNPPNRNGMTKPGHGGLRSALDALEQDRAAGAELAPDRLARLRANVLESLKLRGQLGPLRRYVKTLTVIGGGREAITLLEDAFRLQPQNNAIALLLSDARAAEGATVGALEVLEPLLAAANADAGTLARAAKLHARLGQTQESLALLDKASAQDPDRLRTYLDALINAGQRCEALAKAREILAGNSSDARVCHACYATLWRLRDDPAELARARKQVVERAGSGTKGHLWRARLHHLEGNSDAACAEIDAGLAAAPGDPALTKERCRYALASGRWGRDAALLLNAWKLEAPFLERFRAIAHADDVLRAFGGSLEMAARDPQRFAHVRTPESVFEHVVQHLKAVHDADSHSGLVMIIGSLAAGGAERVVANAFRLLSQADEFAWTKLYVCDLKADTAQDFYLPLTGFARDRVIELGEPQKLEPPLSWLDVDHAEPAQRVLNQLLRDRPAVVHVSLEPLTILGGLVALMAGVPRIVLHTHNMRPADIGMRGAEKMRDCYRVLLSQTAVSLVCCASAAANDYVEWLGSEYRTKILVVHNGVDLENISDESRTALRLVQRAAHGINPDSIVIGTAFRFADVKQPLLWIDAAERIVATVPGCRFVMFGDGELWNQTEQYIAQKGLSAHFILPGRATDILERLTLLDLFMLSSRSEALPNVLLEAQSVGVPVVAFDVGGVSEAMIDGITGRLVKDLSASGLANAALRALSDAEWMSRAGEAGPKFVSEQFSMQEMVKRLSNILLCGPSDCDRQVAPMKRDGTSPSTEGLRGLVRERSE